MGNCFEKASPLFSQMAKLILVGSQPVACFKASAAAANISADVSAAWQMAPKSEVVLKR